MQRSLACKMIGKTSRIAKRAGRREHVPMVHGHTVAYASQYIHLIACGVGPKGPPRCFTSNVLSFLSRFVLIC